ncbi:G-protein coupled receptor family C group 6 member A [Apodemus speciosus]|uniref:G-protein coupled receptor family C group 6 member A n=1 Tax=Apodemus speciosus TaxID=105296 RepID=A0ABQ0F755_APOSI
MLIYIIAWVTFIPVYTTTFGKYLPAVEIIVILISNYGILCCTFFPKCYIILCKQKTNTKSAFLQMVYNYSAHSVNNLALSHVSLDSTSHDTATTNPSPGNKMAACPNHNQLPVQVCAHTGTENTMKIPKTLPQKRSSSV